MRAFLTAALAGCTWLAFASAASADVQVSLHDGRVSIVAKDATVRQILTEWARVGRTKIVNVERIPGGPMTLELKDVPETEALDVLLRSLSGYMAAPRLSSTPDASQFDAIVVMPTTAPPPSRTAGAVPPAPFAPPSGFPTVDDDQGPPGPGQPQRGPIFSTFPQPQVGTPQQRPNLPTVRPGIAPPPDQGQQQVQPPVVFPQPATPNTQSPSPFGAVSTPGMIAPAGTAAGPGGPAAPAERQLMPLVDDVTAAIAEAMRKQDAARLVPLRMLKAAFMNKSVEKGHDLDDAEARQVVSSLVKQRKDSIEQFTRGGRKDLADKEAVEITVLEAYLPPAADPAAVDKAVDDAIAETGATSAEDMGRVMKAAMSKLAGQNVDGKTVNELVRRKLGA